MRLVVGLALGPSAVAVFTPLRTLSNLVIQPLAVIYRLIEPELALAFGAGDSSLFRRLFARATQLSFWGCLGACLLVGSGTYWTFPAWTAGEVAIHWPTYIILLAGVLLRSIWGTAIVVPYATNRHGRIAVFYIPVYGAVAFGLGYLGAASVGLAGAALALLVSEAAMAVIVIRASLRIAHMDMALWVKPALTPPFDILCQVAAGFQKRIRTTLQSTTEKQAKS
jgi:O-antigen/teichoic acid export membrane protein